MSGSSGYLIIFFFTLISFLILYHFIDKEVRSRRLTKKLYFEKKEREKHDELWRGVYSMRNLVWSYYMDVYIRSDIDIDKQPFSNIYKLLGRPKTPDGVKFLDRIDFIFDRIGNKYYSVSDIKKYELIIEDKFPEVFKPIRREEKLNKLGI